MEISPVFAIPALIAGLLAAVMFLYQSAKLRGFKEGVASAQIDPATRLVSPAMAEHMLAVEFAAAERGRPLVAPLLACTDSSRSDVSLSEPASIGIERPI